jgi:hypothetical protein
MINADEAVRFQYMTEGSVAAVPYALAKPFPSGALLVAPGQYQYDNGIAFDLTEEGFYVLWSTAGSGSGQTYDGGMVIVENGDPMLLCASLARACGIGTQDEDLTFAQQVAQARTRAIFMRCGPTSTFAAQWFTSIGIPWREVHWLTALAAGAPGVDLNLDPYMTSPVDAGHICLEVQDLRNASGRWLFADINCDVAFQNPSGGWMSAAAIVAAGGPTASGVKTIQIADTDIQQGVWTSSYNSTVYDNIKQRVGNATRWRQGMYQIQGIMTAGVVYYAIPPALAARTTELTSYIQSEGGVVMDYTAWIAKYYPNGF